jgi:vacuolar protein sorting-associated protein 54
MLPLLIDYLKVIVNLSLLTMDTMSRIIEFLKAFNSQTCQVILGAGVMRSAGLKNITAKHLALALQSLSIMIALIPYMRETFRRHLYPKQAVMLIEFDKLKRDYQEHQNEIHAKLIAIMGDRLSVHIKSLNAIRWDAPPAKPGTNEYMELLVKETVTLHKVLSRYLASAVVEVCRRIHARSLTTDDVWVVVRDDAGLRCHQSQTFGRVQQD